MLRGPSERHLPTHDHTKPGMAADKVPSTTKPSSTSRQGGQGLGAFDHGPSHRVAISRLDGFGIPGANG